VRSTFVTDCLFATSPTNTSPFFAKATIEGVVRAPSAFAITVGSPASKTDTQLFVVPKSIPTALAIFYFLYFLGATFEEGLSLFHEPILNLECLLGQKVEPKWLKVTI
jgi:hypothetical protein